MGFIKSATLAGQPTADVNIWNQRGDASLVSVEVEGALAPARSEGASRAAVGVHIGPGAFLSIACAVLIGNLLTGAIVAILSLK